jgi:hypothetical protein
MTPLWARPLQINSSLVDGGLETAFRLPFLELQPYECANSRLSCISLLNNEAFRLLPRTNLGPDGFGSCFMYLAKVAKLSYSRTTVLQPLRILNPSEMDA